MAPNTNENTCPASVIPRFDLTKDPETLKQGSKQWKLTSQEMKEALNTHGYFLVRYDSISNNDRERLYEAMNSVFNLPVETKRGSLNFDETFPTYLGKSSVIPLYETIRVRKATEKENAEAFTRLMWPEGNEKFCEVLHSMSSKMTALTRVLISMIFDSYGLGKYQEKFMEESDAPFHMIKYSTPEKGEQALGLPAHANPGYLTVLGQNEVAGLMIKNNAGDWVEVDPGQSYFVVFVGQSLRALTNGRLHATFHQVIIRGVKDRLSYALFLTPKNDQIVEALPEMVDDEHPRLFKPYAFGELSKLNRQGSGDVLCNLTGM